MKPSTSPKPPKPPTPQFLRILSSIFQPTETLERYNRLYGDLFTLDAPGTAPLITCSNPEHIQEIFAKAAQFDSGKGNEMLRFLLGDQSLILLDGERHQRQRQLLTPPFHGDRMRAYGQLIRDITQQVIDEWAIDQPFRVRVPMQTITLRVILQAVFGLQKGQRYDQLRHLLTELLESLSAPWTASMIFFPRLQQDLGAWSPWGRFVRLKQQVSQLLYAEIAERRHQADLTRTDILSLLMAARDEAGQPMTDQELHDELMTLLVAGHETTASALTWALYWVYTRSDVLARLRQELEEVAGSDPVSLTQLPYLNAICQETVRIYPIAMFAFPRIAKQQMEIAGYQFEAGTWFIPCVYLTHQRNDIYPEPKRFKPERFLERQFSPYEYFPFGGSNRRCIGMAFAQFEMKIVLGTIVSQFQLVLNNRRPVRPVRRGLTLAAPSRLQMVAIERRQQAKPVMTIG